MPLETLLENGVNIKNLSATEPLNEESLPNPIEVISPEGWQDIEDTIEFGYIRTIHSKVQDLLQFKIANPDRFTQFLKRNRDVIWEREKMILYDARRQIYEGKPSLGPFIYLAGMAKQIFPEYESELEADDTVFNYVDTEYLKLGLDLDYVYASRLLFGDKIGSFTFSDEQIIKYLGSYKDIKDFPDIIFRYGQTRLIGPNTFSERQVGKDALGEIKKTFYNLAKKLNNSQDYDYDYSATLEAAAGITILRAGNAYIDKDGFIQIDNTENTHEKAPPIPPLPKSKTY